MSTRVWKLGLTLVHHAVLARLEAWDGLEHGRRTAEKEQLWNDLGKAVAYQGEERGTAGAPSPSPLPQLG